MLIVNNPELITPLDKCWFCSSTLIVIYHNTEKRWCHNGCFWNLMLSELVVLLISYFATYIFFLFSINVCFMNKIHTTSVMLSLSWYLTVSYGGTNPLPWPHGIIIHALQNLSRSSRSSRYIWYILLTVLWIQWIGLYDSIHILFFTYYIVENNACLDTASVLLLLAHKTKIEFPIPHKKSRFLVRFFILWKRPVCSFYTFLY